jgi:anti-anti-sigma factor
MTNEHFHEGTKSGSSQAHCKVTNGAVPLASTKTTCIGTTALVEIVGEIDRSNADFLGIAVADGATNAQRVVIDLSRVGYLDSAALSMLQTFAMRGTPTDLIAPVGGRARRLLDIAGIDLALRVFETVAEANVEG